MPDGESAGYVPASRWKIMTSTLDRAAFRARQSDAVILVGRASPGTMAAITAWAADAVAGGDVALAPVSKALGG